MWIRNMKAIPPYTTGFLLLLISNHISTFEECKGQRSVNNALYYCSCGDHEYLSQIMRSCSIMDDDSCSRNNTVVTILSSHRFWMLQSQTRINHRLVIKLRWLSTVHDQIIELSRAFKVSILQ